MAALEDFLSLSQFDSQLRDLHEKARAGTLDGKERTTYERARGDLARMLVFAQQLNRRPGETFRQALRVPVALPLAVALESGATESSQTLDVSVGGFAALFKSARTVGSTLAFKLDLPMVNHAVLSGSVRVVASSPRDGSFRVSFSIQDLDAVGRERLEIVTFDWVISQIDLLKKR